MWRKTVAQHPTDKPLLAAYRFERQETPPIWFMRQAGRYLPEYRALRQRVGSFLELCLTPELASTVTLQPIERFQLDGAIVFADILLVPYGLGQPLWFEEGVGPQLEPLKDPGEVATRLDGTRFHETLAPMYAALRQTKAQLPAQTALIGFAGAPWTVASYMIEGRSSRDFALSKQWAYGDPAGFQRLIDRVVEMTIDYLLAQIDAGAEAVQLFDSWAGALPAAEAARWSLEPLQRIIAGVKAQHPDVPVVVFPRGTGAFYARMARESGADAVSLDTGVPLDWARGEVQAHACAQGNLDPQHVVVGGESMRAAAREIVDGLAGGPFVFNLGHGIVPQTPPEHVADLVACVRNRGREGDRS
jgi:uroporphyrinogen decarboxylase